MKDVWLKFEGWLGENFKEGLKDLGSPASKEEISELEKHLSVELPESFKMFLEIHNGQKGLAGGLIDTCELLSSTRIIDEWSVWDGLLKSGDFDGMEEDRANGVKGDWWNLKWIPFTYDGAGNHLCIDLDPAENGVKGQIITMWHDDDEREVVSTSFDKWFASYVNDVVQGKYIYHDDYESIVSIDDI